MSPYDLSLANMLSKPHANTSTAQYTQTRTGKQEKETGKFPLF
jgi:hypothetical protein